MLSLAAWPVCRVNPQIRPDIGTSSSPAAPLKRGKAEQVQVDQIRFVG
jgi:hypothetical protein